MTAAVLTTGQQSPNATVNVASGVYVAPVCVVDASGNFVESAGSTVVSGTVAVSSVAGTVTTSGAVTGTVALFRDAQVTAQVSTAAANPGAGGTVATVTPGTAGLWEVSVTVSVSGTTVGATDSSNMALYQTSTARLTPISYVVATTGSSFQTAVPPLILNLSAVDTVNVKAIGATTSTATYTAAVVCRRVG